MKSKVVLVSEDLVWAKSLEKALMKPWFQEQGFEIEVTGFKDWFNTPENRYLFLVDGRFSKLAPFLKDLFKIEDSKRRLSVFLQGSLEGLKPYASDLLDDHLQGVVSESAHALELLSILLQHEKRGLWLSLLDQSAGVSEVTKTMLEQVKKIENLQKERVLPKFPDLKGVRFHSRYYSGQSMGSEYLDAGLSKDQRTLSFLMAKSSSFGVSGALLSVSLKLMGKLYQDSTLEPHEMIMMLVQEMGQHFDSGDQLSLFFGRFDTKSWELKYSNAGNAKLYYVKSDHTIHFLSSEDSKFDLTSKTFQCKTSKTQILQGEKLLLLSEGAVHQWKEKPSSELWSKEGSELLNEVSYQIKKDQMDQKMLQEDCSMILLETESGGMRLLS